MSKAFWIAVALCFLLTSPVMASDYSLMVNGMTVYSDVPPVVEGANVLLPLRAVAEAAGATVQFVDSQRELIISKPGLEVLLWLDNYSGFKNGAPLFLTSPPKLVNDRTFVSRDLLAQIMDVKSYFNAQTNSIEVKS